MYRHRYLKRTKKIVRWKGSWATVCLYKCCKVVVYVLFGDDVEFLSSINHCKVSNERLYGIVLKNISYWGRTFRRDLMVSRIYLKFSRTKIEKDCFWGPQYSNFFSTDVQEFLNFDWYLISRMRLKSAKIYPKLKS